MYMIRDILQIGTYRASHVRDVRPNNITANCLLEFNILSVCVIRGSEGEISVVAYFEKFKSSFFRFTVEYHLVPRGDSRYRGANTATR